MFFSLKAAPQVFFPKNNQIIFLTIVYLKIARYAAPQAPKILKIQSVKAISYWKIALWRAPKSKIFAPAARIVDFFNSAFKTPIFLAFWHTPPPPRGVY